MTQTVDAIFEDGVFKPLTRPEITEHQKVHLLVELSPAPYQASSPVASQKEAGQQLLKTLREISRPLGGKPWKQRDDLYER